MCVCVCVCVYMLCFVYVCVYVNACMRLYVCSSMCLSYLPPPPLGQDMTQGQFLSEV